MVDDLPANTAAHGACVLGAQNESQEIFDEPYSSLVDLYRAVSTLQH